MEDIVKKIEKEFEEILLEETLSLAVGGDDKYREIFSNKIKDALNGILREFNKLSKFDKSPRNWREKIFGRTASFGRILRVHSLAGEIVGYCKALLDCGILEEEIEKETKSKIEFFEKITNQELNSEVRNSSHA